MNSVLKEKNCTVSNIFATARIYALISVVAAHIYFATGTVSTIFSRIGTVGVVAFLIMAGYFYKYQKFGSFLRMVKRKFFSVIVPWLVLGSLTWLYKFILTPDKSNAFVWYLKWIIGNGSYLYYLTALILCFVLFYKAKTPLIILSLAVTVISILCTAADLLDGVVSVIGINNYLNVFNWFGFFGLGILLQRVREEKIVAFFTQWRWLIIALFNAALIVLVIFKDVKADYFSYVAIPYELLGAAAIFSLSTINLVNIPLFKALSNLSYTIYLINVLPMAFLDNILNLHIVALVLSPIVIIAVCFMLLLLIGWVAKKIGLEKVFRLISGARSL